MKRRTSVKEDDRIDMIPEYGRQKLLAYADSFRDLADLFEDTQGKTGLVHILAVTARETYRCRPMGERRYKQMAAMLRESGIMLKDFLELEHEDGHREISLVMRQIGGKRTHFGETEYISTEDVADYISVAMNCRLCAAKNTPAYLAAEYNAYYFLEEPPYHLLTGFAKAVKETEKVSGDSYSFFESDTDRI